MHLLGIVFIVVLGLLAILAIIFLTLLGNDAILKKLRDEGFFD